MDTDVQWIPCDETWDEIAEASLLHDPTPGMIRRHAEYVQQVAVSNRPTMATVSSQAIPGFSHR
jgi:hypothetical protein